MTLQQNFIRKAYLLHIINAAEHRFIPLTALQFVKLAKSITSNDCN